MRGTETGQEMGILSPIAIQENFRARGGNLQGADDQRRTAGSGI